MAPSPLHLVTVDNTPQTAKVIMEKLTAEVKQSCTLVHIANCENIAGVKYVLKSLVIEPYGLICSGNWFEEEKEEIREMAQRLLPGIKLVMIPSDLGGVKARAVGGGKGNEDEMVVAFLKEQVEGWMGV